MKIAALLLALLVISNVAMADANVLSGGCGSVTYTAGTKPTTQDTAGRECTSGTAIIVPSSDPTAGITPVVSASAEATHVLKSSAGNLYGVYAINQTATNGFLVILNLTAAPADGAITPLDCVPLAANSVGSISFGSGPPAVYSTGITAVITSAATCFTKTTGVITGFIRGAVK